jgi:glycosyltransferase involved in cell wall biosynthesis
MSLLAWSERQCAPRSSGGGISTMIGGGRQSELDFDAFCPGSPRFRLGLFTGDEYAHASPRTREPARLATYGRRTVMEDGMRLLALVDSPDHVCCRYRIRAFEPALVRSGGSLTCQPLSRGIVSRVAQFGEAARYDSVILQRKLLPAWQLAILRRHARHLVFDFDDAVLFRDSYDRRGPHSAWRERRFAATVRFADAVIAGNDFLADCALRAGAPAERVRLIPTCVEPRLYDAAGIGRTGENATGHVDLVWIGSSSTLKGLEQEQALWDRLGSEVPGLRLRVICDRFPGFSTIPVVPVPWSEETEARDLSAGQIGISLLPDDLWSRGKCGLKVLQYQAAGLPVVANTVGMNIELIEPGATGYLAGTPDQWVEAVRTLAADPQRRLRMGQLARQRVESGFSVEAWEETFVSSVTGVHRPILAENSRPRGSGHPSGSIPDPFFLRLRRMDNSQRSAHAGRLGRNGDLD